MNMQMLFTFYHMVRGQVRRGGPPTHYDERTASGNTLCQEELNPGDAREGGSASKAAEGTNVLI